jgi:hypothetical protein
MRVTIGSEGEMRRTARVIHVESFWDREWKESIVGFGKMKWDVHVGDNWYLHPRHMVVYHYHPEHDPEGMIEAYTPGDIVAECQLCRAAVPIGIVAGTDILQV